MNCTGMRVLLLAMSGVRVQDRELMALGLTLPGFVERSEVIASLPSLGLLTVGALCPDDWEVAYREFDGGAIEALVDDVVAGGFGVVAISSLTARILEAYAVAQRLRAAGVRVVLGGLHATAMPDEAECFVDAVVVGEGESCWPEVVSDLQNNRLRPRYVSSRTADTFRSPPLPRYDLLDPGRYNRITIQTTRGCPLHCHFCGASRLLSPFRKKAINWVRRDLEAILDRWPRPFLELADDNTFVDKSWGRDLARLLAEYPVRWFTETDISVAEDEELLAGLANSGCAQILIGLESARPSSLAGIEARDWKRRQFDDYAEKVMRIQNYGISVNGCFILGFDTDDEEIFKETLAFVDLLNLAEVQVTLLTAFPGTALTASLRREGRLMPEPFWDRCTLFDLTFEPAGMSAAALRDGFRWLMGEIYSAERVEGRRRIFRECARVSGRHAAVARELA